MIQLTQQQHMELEATSGEPIRAVDPENSAEYVLVRADVYDRLRKIFTEQDSLWSQGAHAAAMEVFARDGWDDPQMDVYNSLPAVEPT